MIRPSPLTRYSPISNGINSILNAGLDTMRSQAEIAAQIALGSVISKSVNGVENLGAKISEATSNRINAGQQAKVQSAKTGGSGQTKPNIYATKSSNSSGNYKNNDGGPIKGYSINLNVDPTVIDFNSGIIPNIYSGDSLIYDIGESPLHITCAEIQIPDSSALIANHFEKLITQTIQNLAQGNVSYSINLNYLTFAALRTYFNSVIDALNVKYHIESILLYASIPSNKNETIRDMRSNLSVVDIEYYTRISQLLEGLPIPPNIVDICWFYNQFYSQSEMPGSPLCMIVPRALEVTETIVTTKIKYDADAIINALTADRNLTMLLGRAFPAWVTSEIPSSASTPLYSADFNTVWANLPFEMTNKLGTIASLGPATANITDNIKYYTHSNQLDGVFYGLSGIYDSTELIWRPGLIKPVITTLGTLYSNRFSSGTASFYISDHFPNVQSQRGQTYFLNSVGEITACRPFGAQKIENANAFGMRETAFQTLEYMMSLDQIGAPMNKNLINPMTVPRNPDKRTQRSPKKRTMGKTNKGKPRKDAAD